MYTHTHSHTDGLKVRNLDLTATEMKVISLKDIAKEPAGPVVRYSSEVFPSLPLYIHVHAHSC